MTRILSFIVFAIAFCAVLYAAVCVYLYFNQRSLIFFPVRTDRTLATQWAEHRVVIHTGDADIEGWWAENERSTGDRTVIYFGGNAEEVLQTASLTHRLNVRRALFTHYRGYGGSSGSPSEQALFADALSIYDYVVREKGIDPSQIVLMGRSLGSGVSTYLAAHREARGVILITPYDSMVAVARTHYPFVPVGLLLTNRFESARYAAGVKAPVLMLAARDDVVIPFRHAETLYDAWAGEKKLKILPGVGHNGIDASIDYYPLLNAFLNTLTN